MDDKKPEENEGEKPGGKKVTVNLRAYLRDLEGLPEIGSNPDQNQLTPQKPT